MLANSVVCASALATVILLLSPRPAAAQTVPTPESVLGHEPGDDFYLANYDESRELCEENRVAGTQCVHANRFVSAGSLPAGCGGWYSALPTNCFWPLR
jgi:hypothetical protein